MNYLTISLIKKIAFGAIGISVIVGISAFTGAYGFVRNTLLGTISLSSASFACDFYVAPAGAAQSDGSLNNPWDLPTALSQPASVVPGKTICLRGGTYTGIFDSNLHGSASAPIIVRSAPGEWARIDGYLKTTLAQDLTAASNTIVLSDANGFPDSVSSYTTVWLGEINSQSGDQVEQAILRGKNGNVYNNSIRGWSGSTPRAYPAGTSVIRQAEGIITINGSNTVYRDFEVLYSGLPRSFNYVVNRTGGTPGARPEGLNIFAPGTKVINVVIHDTREGIGLWEQAKDSEIYGTVIYNNGFVDSARGHGHGLYIQNEASGSKAIREVASLNNFASGMKAYGERGFANNVRFEGVVSFNNGSPNGFAGNPANFSPNSRSENLFVGTAVQPIVNATIHNNYLYHPSNSAGQNLDIGYLSIGGRGISVQNNYVAGATNTFGMRYVSDAIVANNVFYGNKADGDSDQFMVNLSTAKDATIVWNNNSYYDDHQVFSGTGKSYDFSDSYNYTGFADNPTVADQSTGIFTTNSAGGGKITYSEPATDKGKGWIQWTGFDANSTYQLGKPTINQTFVRCNAYQPGRANIAVYNWTNKNEVVVDLSQSGCLTSGQSFKIVKAENYFGSPVYEGTYNSISPLVTLPMNNISVAPVIGAVYTPASTCPQFCAFIIIPTSNGSVITPTALPSNTPVPTITPTSTPIPTETPAPTPTSTPTPSIVPTPTASPTPTPTLTPSPTPSPIPSPSVSPTPSATPQPGDTTPPQVSLSQPKPDAILYNIVTIRAKASDNKKIAVVQFFLDGKKIGNDEKVSPYSIQWDSRSATNGAHVITTKATDSSGNVAISPSVNVTVYNPQFSIGAKVVASEPIRVRANPSSDARSLEIKPAGVSGKVVAGPIFADNKSWYKIDYDSGKDGWSISRSLKLK